MDQPNTHNLMYYENVYLTLVLASVNFVRHISMVDPNDHQVSHTHVHAPNKLSRYMMQNVTLLLNIRKGSMILVLPYIVLSMMLLVFIESQTLGLFCVTCQMFKMNLLLIIYPFLGWYHVAKL